MRKFLLLSIIPLISLSVFSQKVIVTVVKTKDVSVSEWQILDDKFMQVITGNDNAVADITVFSLDANKRYYFFVSVSEIIYQDTLLFSLSLNNEPMLLADDAEGTGDHFYPFFTGIREDKEAKITGGTDADISDFPWQVYLETPDFTCGSSIIDQNWIITAAHCTKDDNDKLSSYYYRLMRYFKSRQSIWGVE